MSLIQLCIYNFIIYNIFGFKKENHHKSIFVWDIKISMNILTADNIYYLKKIDKSA